MLGQQGIVFGGKLIHVRESARVLKMDPATLSKILNGSRPVGSLRMGTVAALAKHFGFASVEKFMGAVTARRVAKGLQPSLTGAPGGSSAASSQWDSPLSCVYCGGKGRPSGCPACGRSMASASARI